MTTIDMTNADEREFFRAAQLKGQLKILRAGMTIRGLTKTEALRRAGTITGETYKRGQIEDAIYDLGYHVEKLIAAKAST
jgi:hypothetical protein